ncbi:MAG TPA: cysteine desulfurase family protein [Candidatus Paceibacterota bacterium]|nr:cysteine desulfurase family protein [Candidatus Paceibacterota bacterium]
MFFKRLWSRPYKRTYLDYAASTPVDEKMIASFPALTPEQLIGNPGALHREGLAAKKVISDARERIAKQLRAHADEIIFTSGATEANNLAVLGTIRSWRAHGIPAHHIELITTELEHPAIFETAKALQKEGIEVSFLKVNESGVNVKSLSPNPAATHVLVTCMYVHNELGTIFPIKEIAKRIRFLKKQNPGLEIIFHTDATQAPNTIAIDIPTLGVDMFTIGATKLYTHKGVGMLFKKRSIKLTNFLYGGGQEFGLVPGTEPVYLVDLFSRAFAYAQTHAEKINEKLSKLQSYFEKRITTEIPNVHIDDIHLKRSPHITHLSISNFDSELLVLELDARGIAISSQSACTDVAPPDSYMKRFGDTTGLLRFSFGRFTTKADLDRAVKALKEVLEKYKNL